MLCHHVPGFQPSTPLASNRQWSFSLSSLRDGNSSSCLSCLLSALVEFLPIGSAHVSLSPLRNKGAWPPTQSESSLTHSCRKSAEL
ncbi:hypothetical protein OH77DRAFT_170658 [Trametes cingulata]|nr:hypothetical protein OH77DRAFT_170658 [Trametes cingulata]